MCWKNYDLESECISSTTNFPSPISCTQKSSCICIRDNVMYVNPNALLEFFTLLLLHHFFR